MYVDHDDKISNKLLKAAGGGHYYTVLRVFSFKKIKILTRVPLKKAFDTVDDKITYFEIRALWNKGKSTTMVYILPNRTKTGL
jgi:hypothetical protein